MVKGMPCFASVSSALISLFITEGLFDPVLSFSISELEDFDGFGIVNVHPLNNSVERHIKDSMHSFNL
ncbi:MAG: hypothetical protein K8F52_06560 [Candidatus Scalindua rubra]|nr:hypothetical protein [Candidatus Scalindua rubra]